MKLKRYTLLTLILMFMLAIPVYASEGSEPSGGNGLFPALDDVKDFLIHIVIPRDGFFEEQYEKIDGELKGKLPFKTYTDTIGRLQDIAENKNAAVLKFEYFGKNIELDMGEFIKPFADKFKPIITGLYVLFIAFYNYRQIMHLIRGVNYSNIQMVESKEPIGFHID